MAGTLTDGTVEAPLDARIRVTGARIAVAGDEYLLDIGGTPGETVGVSDTDLADAFAAHEAEADPHPQYLTRGEGDGLYDEAGAAAAVDSAAAAALAAHAAAADPHPVYTTAAEVTALLPGYATRTALVFTSSSLATGATEVSTVTAHPGIRALKLATTRAARVRVYASAAYRTADAARPVGTDPTGDHGLLLEVVTTGAVLSVYLSPAADMHSADGSSDLYWAVTNNGAAGTVQTTLTYIQTE